MWTQLEELVSPQGKWNIGFDIVLTGPTKKLVEFEKKMTSVYPIKAKNIKTLNRRLLWTKRGIVYQHDPRHVDVLVKDLGLEHGNSCADASDTRCDGRRGVGTIKSSSASTIQITSCQMFISQSGQVHRERILSEDVESQPAES